FTILSISVVWITAPKSNQECRHHCDRCWNTGNCRGFPKWKGNEPPCDAEWVGSVCRCHVKCPYMGRQCVPLNVCKEVVRGKLKPQPFSDTTVAPKNKVLRILLGFNIPDDVHVGAEISSDADLRPDRIPRIQNAPQDPETLPAPDEVNLVRRSGENAPQDPDTLSAPDELALVRRSDEIAAQVPETLSAPDEIAVVRRSDETDAQVPDTLSAPDELTLARRSDNNIADEPETLSEPEENTQVRRSDDNIADEPETLSDPEEKIVVRRSNEESDEKEEEVEYEF
ncbi:unnamed protein product, partial [Allacma fusca]